MAIKLQVQDDNIPLRVPQERNVNLHSDAEWFIVEDYDNLEHKPQIEGVTLEGNKTFADLGLDSHYQPLSERVTEVDADSTDNEYPTAKAVYDFASDKPYLKAVGHFYFWNPSHNYATLEFVNGGTLEEALKQPVQVYGSFNDADLAYIGQASMQIDPNDDTYSVVFPQSVQWVIFFSRVRCGGASFRYNSGTQTFSFQQLIKGTELLLNKVQSIPTQDVDMDTDRYPSVQAIRAMFDGLQASMEAGASASKTLTDLQLDYNGDLVPTFADIPIPTKTSELTNDGSDNTSTYVEADKLATVATSGNYNDLSNKPTIPAAQVNADWNAVSGVAEILNKPTIPAAQVNADWDAVSGVAEILNKPTIPAAQVNSDWNAVSGVAQILNKPTIPAAQVNSDWNANSGVAEVLNKPTKTSAFTNDGSDGNAAYLETDETAYRTSSIPWAQVDATSTATVFTATLPGITELRDGVSFWLKNGVVTSASGFTVNVNGLGAKKCYNSMTAATQDTTIFNINYTMLFVYDSTLDSGNGGYYIYRGYDANTNTIGYQVRTNSQSLPMKSITYRYRVLFTSADRKHYVPANNATSTNATASRAVCQDPIDPFGAIYYYGTTASVAADARPAASSLWQQYTFSLGYSFNRTGAALTMDLWKPVYVKCTPQADGSAIIDSTTPFVQDLPTTEDGKIYIFLGIAYSATNIEMTMCHPVYYYKGGRIRLWTGETYIPDPPSADGVYKLTCTVSSGVPTYSWEA